MKPAPVRQTEAFRIGKADVVPSDNQSMFLFGSESLRLFIQRRSNLDLSPDLNHSFGRLPKEQRRRLGNARRCCSKAVVTDHRGRATVLRAERRPTDYT